MQSARAQRHYCVPVSRAQMRARQILPLSLLPARSTHTQQIAPINTTTRIDPLSARGIAPLSFAAAAAAHEMAAVLQVVTRRLPWFVKDPAVAVIGEVSST